MMLHDKRFILLFKLRHLWGRILGMFAKHFPRVTARLRSFGFPVNGYLPRLARPIRNSSIRGGKISPTKVRGRTHPSLQELIDEQAPPRQNFSGNIRPIRISRIRKVSQLPTVVQPRDGISPIWPGDPYEFESESQYLGHYAHFAYALSPRKGGWDTMRSVELCSVGTFPLIPHLDQTAEAVMFGYPKFVLSGLWKMADDGWLPSPTEGQHTWLREWCEKYLTSTAQANFVLDQLGFFESMSGQVLYLDMNLKMTPDYVSMGNLVGLHRVLGQDLKTFFWPEYLTSSSDELAMTLYGRGFGYSGELSQDFQDSALLSSTYPTSLKDLLQKAEEAVRKSQISHIILGGLEYCDESPSQRLTVIRAIEEMELPVALIYGGDFTLSKRDLLELSSSSLLFVREFETGFQFPR